MRKPFLLLHDLRSKLDFVLVALPPVQPLHGLLGLSLREDVSAVKNVEEITRALASDIGFQVGFVRSCRTANTNVSRHMEQKC